MTRTRDLIDLNPSQYIFWHAFAQKWILVDKARQTQTDFTQTFKEA